MGYRLEFKDPNHEDNIIFSCGGKLYGYMDDDFDVKSFKSWQWMKRNGFFDDYKYDWDKETVILSYDEEYAENWGYGFRHTMYLSKEQFLEFIKLYIEDRNTYYLCDVEYKDSIKNYYDVLKLNVVLCEWW